MPIVKHSEVPFDNFHEGATYQTIVGDDEGTTPGRLGIQVSQRGYETRTHAHPYMEIITILEGTGEGWMEGVEGVIKLEPGISMVLPAGCFHGFRATGPEPLKTYGLHFSPDRLSSYLEEKEEVPSTA